MRAGLTSLSSSRRFSGTRGRVDGAASISTCPACPSALFLFMMLNSLVRCFKRQLMNLEIRKRSGVDSSLPVAMWGQESSSYTGCSLQRFSVEKRTRPKEPSRPPCRGIPAPRILSSYLMGLTARNGRRPRHAEVRIDCQPESGRDPTGGRWGHTLRGSVRELPRPPTAGPCCCVPPNVTGPLVKGLA